MKTKTYLLGACALAVASAISTGAIAQDAPVAAVDVVKTEQTQAVKTVTLPAGSQIAFAMEKTLATDKREWAKGEKKDKTKERLTNPGETFYMSVVNDVTVDGQVVVPKGSRGVGEVLTVTGRGGFGKSGKIEVEMKYVEVGGKQYAMEGVHLQKGKGRGGAAVAGVILAGALAGVFIKGDEADMPEGMQLSFRTKENITADVASSTGQIMSKDAAPQDTEAAKPEGVLEDIAKAVDAI